MTLGLGSPRLLRLFLTGDMRGLCAAHVSGELAVDGQAQDVLQIGITIAEQVGKSPLLCRIAPFLLRRRWRRTKARDAADVRFHYDVSTEFYRLWLDMRVIVTIIAVLAVVVTALAHARPTSAKPTLFEIAMEHFVDLTGAGCGPGWHWSNRRGWNWGHCVLDWRPDR